MTTTPILDVTEMEQNPTNADITVNEAVRTLEAAIQLVVINQTRTTTPTSPSDGDRYVIADSATGDWSGHDNEIAWYSGTDWRFYDPIEGWEIYDQSLDGVYRYDGAAWLKDGARLDTETIGLNYSVDANIPKQNFRVIADVDLTIDNAPSAGETREIDLIFSYGTNTITWPTDFDWGTAGAPTQTADKTLWVRVLITDVIQYAVNMGTFDPAETIIPLTILNPADDPVDTANWTNQFTGVVRVTGTTPNRQFEGGSADANNYLYQSISMSGDGVSTAEIDADNVSVVVMAYISSWDDPGDSDDLRIGVTFWDGGASIIGAAEYSPYYHYDTFTLVSFTTAVPSLTRDIRVKINFRRNNGTANNGTLKNYRAAVYYDN